MHACTGFRDDALFAHLLGQQYLTDAVVDLVRAGVIQLFALQVNTRPAKVLGQPLGKVERAWPPHIITLKISQLALEFGVVLSDGVLVLQL